MRRSDFWSPLKAPSPCSFVNQLYHRQLCIFASKCNPLEQLQFRHLRLQKDCSTQISLRHPGLLNPVASLYSNAAKAGKEETPAEVNRRKDGDAVD